LKGTVSKLKLCSKLIFEHIESKSKGFNLKIHVFKSFFVIYVDLMPFEWDESQSMKTHQISRGNKVCPIKSNLSIIAFLKCNLFMMK